jgi:hypothetical protein
MERVKFIAKIDVSSFEVLNSEFTKARCYVLYTGENRNGSFISKETVEEALPSLFNCPVIAEMIDKKDGTKDYGTHGGKIIISSEGIEYIQTTVPYGVVPESANPRWEMVNDKEYLVCDIILWSGRYDDLEIFLADGVRPQSMEISPLDFVEKDNLYEIKSFEFSALTILGSDIEPCFENAKIETFGVDIFEKEYKEMLDKFKEYAAQSEEENLQIFSLTMKEKLQLLQNSIEDERIADNDDNTISYTSYWVMDFDENYVYINIYGWANDGSNKDYYVRGTYTIDEENNAAIINKDSFETIIQKWVTETEAQEIVSARQTMEANFEALQIEIIPLRELQAKVRRNEREEHIKTILDEFSEQLTDNEDYKKFRIEAIEKDLDDGAICEKCYAILGKVKFELKPKKDKEKLLATVIKARSNKDADVANRYGSAIRFFTPKE